jgi:hypothetical protein
MIWHDAAGYHVRIWEPGQAPLEYGPYPTWADSFAVEMRVHAQLHQERAPRKPRATPPADLPLLTVIEAVP